MRWSWSAAETFSRCPYLYQLKYERGIRPIAATHAIDLGRMVEAFVLALGGFPQHLQEVPNTNDPDTIEIARQASLIAHRTAHWLGLGSRYVIERAKERFEIPLANFIEMVGEFDIVLREVSTDLRILVDLKVQSSMPDPSTLACDGQTALYAAALESEDESKSIRATGQWVALSSIPYVRRNKDGSPAKNSACTPEQMIAAWDARGMPHDPVVLDRLRQKKWDDLQITLRDWPQLERTWLDVVAVGVLARDNPNHRPRHMSRRNCAGCQMSSWCLAEYVGQDPTPMLGQLYEVKNEPK